MKEIHILNVRLSEEITTWIDSLVSSRQFSSRSEAVRNFIREYMREKRK